MTDQHIISRTGR